MHVADINEKESNQFIVNSEWAGAILFFFLDLIGMRFFDSRIFGLVVNCFIGFGVGMFIGYFINHIKKEIEKSKRTSMAEEHDRNAVQKYQNKDYYGAIKEYQAALEIEPANPKLHFNLACMYSLVKNKEEAFIHLSYAAKYKYENLFEKIMASKNLAFIRHQLEFDYFIENGFRLKTSW